MMEDAPQPPARNIGLWVGEEGQAVGKRLDFLAQEIFRELSTLAAKFRDPATVQRVIDGKLVCEQIREQVQNIE